MSAEAADEVAVEGADEQAKVAKHDRVGANDLERVTDYVEEHEISSGTFSNAFSEMEDQQTAEQQEKRAREKELARVKLTKEDVDSIVNEMEVSQAVAERTLRQHGGDLVSALADLTN